MFASQTFFHHRRRHHRRWGVAESDASLPAMEMPARAAGPSPTIRLFTCVGRDCRNAWKGGNLVESLRAEIVRSGVAGIDVQSCGCLDQCDKGPVVLAYQGKAAQAVRPPKGALSSLLNRPLARFFQATPDQARHIIDTVIRRK